MFTALEREERLKPTFLASMMRKPCISKLTRIHSEGKKGVTC